MKTLVTGGAGFIGSNLVDAVVARGDQVAVIDDISTGRRENLDQAISNGAELIELDVRDAEAVSAAVERTGPEAIFHLAAQSFVPASWDGPADTLATNVGAQVNLLEAMRELGLTDVPLHIAGSSEEYGLVFPEETPITEENPLRPLSPYAVSKVTQDLLGWQYHRSFGLRVVRTRAFNHEGPRRGYVFVTSNFAKQIAEIEAGKRLPVLEVGNLEARRDWHDVRDTVVAYWLAAFEGEPGEVYNIGRGEATSVREMLDLLLSMAKVDVEVRPVAERMRPSDVELLVCDPSKFKQRTGWEPKIPFDQTLRDTLEYWRERV
jgi:GDP-4-dehydro-6-deoxy-D-mannose reductase